jgi:hypothetical protein
MKKIELSQGKFALVDDENFEWLNRWNWVYGCRGYAVRTIHIKSREGKRKTIMVWMHREVAKTPQGFQTDHINGDRLDNRSENLRIVTSQRNKWNSSMPFNNTSGYKGVSKRNNKWEASIHLNDKKFHLGYFSTKEEAANAYNEVAKQNFGDYSKLNQIQNIVFEYEYLPSQEQVRDYIKSCESLHTQQAIYSTFHDGLTQICFGCKKIRTTIYLREK